MDRGAWQATVHGVARVRHDLVTREREREPLSSQKECHLKMSFFLRKKVEKGSKAVKQLNSG